MNMEIQSSFRNADTDENLTGSSTSVEEILGALARRGCSNLTSSIDLTACSEFSCAQGGLCDIYQGVLDDGTVIAIKSLRIYGDQERVRILKSAARELYHWSKLQHRNVLPLMGLTIFREHISLVSGWMENGSLVSYLKRRPDVNRTKLCMDICAGLCYIHTVDMVHGDLKAANVMISSDGTALIADFGNAQLRDFTLKFTNSSKLDLSVRWAAPELLVPGTSIQASKEADVYAFGMTILEVLTGKVPFYETRDYLIPCLVARGGKVPPRPDIGIRDDLWDLLNWCWTRDPARRPGISSIMDRLQDLFQPPFDTWSIKDTTPQSHGSESTSKRGENAGDAVPVTHAGPLEVTRQLAFGENGEEGEESAQRYLLPEFGDQSGQNYSDYEEEESEEELSEEAESRGEDSESITSDRQQWHSSSSSEEDPSYPHQDRDNQPQTTSVPTIAINSSPNDLNNPSVPTPITDENRLNPTYQPPEHARVATQEASLRALLDGNASHGGIQPEVTRPLERVHVTTPATREANSNRTTQANYKCPVPGCGSIFTRHFNLRAHIRSHNEERPFKCRWPGCDKGFARQHDLKRHEALHLNIRPYTCEGCNKTFARMDALNRHLRSEGGAECRREQSEVTEAHPPENTTQTDTQVGSSSVAVHQEKIWLTFESTFQLLSYLHN